MAGGAKEDRRNITRMFHTRENEYGGWSTTRGWWVRIYRTDWGEKRTVVSKFFSDAVHGGRRAALEKAIRYRNQQQRKVRPASKGGGDGPVPPGHGYVRRVERWQKVDWHPAWCAWIRLEGGRCASTTASIERWGVAEAKRRCEAFLAKHRRELRKRGVTVPRARGRAS